ncbi:MAG: hypothetical protein KC731_29750 [Myxococcales bacterium]|nr:hypothetical protein [Myxococcales bacterium]
MAIIGRWGRWAGGLSAVVLLVLGACGGDGGGDDGGSDGGGGTTTGQGTGSGSSGQGAGATTGAGAGGCDGGPLAEPIPNCMPAPLAKTGDFGQDCVDRINQFRWECQCLPPLARWSEAEICTDTQSGNDQGSGTGHANFGACGENAQNTCPNWGSEEQVLDGCLQMMWDEGPGQPFEAHGHYLNMSSTEYGKVACGFAVNGGDVWSNQNFAP